MDKRGVFGKFVAWVLSGALVWFYSAVIVWMSLVGDWDDPHPPNPIAAWSVAAISMAAITLIARSMRVRAVLYTAFAMLPVQLVSWGLFVIPNAGIAN
ncbi:hypothetical protein [Candidatus Poriferisodalis sp.]|uniref:hypothetical protein n=1 Tax=Candidatus Poriferisodalis sp. TaxID=3101277 RepID=UPI003B0186B0